MTSGDGLAPRWSGQPGWFEIWFVVAFAPDGERAWWFRSTTFAPLHGSARGVLWAAAFRRGCAPVWGKTFVDVDAARAAAGDLAEGRFRGRVDAGGHAIEWSLALDGGASGGRAPAWLGRVPAPTHVEHVRSEAVVEGSVIVDGTPERVTALGVLKHIWGTRRVDELYWVYCPSLEGGGALEATSVRVHAAGPAVSPVLLRLARDEHRWWRAPGIFRQRVVAEGPGRLRVRAVSATRRLDVVAACDPASLAGYVYRDPAGHDLYVAQSDVARVDGSLAVRGNPLAAWSAPRPIAGAAAAIELHQPAPLPGVPYVAWDAVSV